MQAVTGCYSIQSSKLPRERKTQNWRGETEAYARCKRWQRCIQTFDVNAYSFNIFHLIFSWYDR